MNVPNLKVVFLKLTFFAGFFLTACTAAVAQRYTLIEPRFIVNAPYAMSGPKHFVASNRGSYANVPAHNWGRLIDSGWLNIPVAKASDTTGCTPLLPLTGVFALVYRNGACAFEDRAYAAQQAGAIGVIVVSNTSGKQKDFPQPGTLAASVTIPVICVSRQTGDSLCAAINSGSPVYVTLTGWGLNLNHDLAIGSPVALPPYSAVPLSQMSVGNGNPSAYRLYNGAIAANTGVSTESGVTVITTVNFTPSGGSVSQLYQDSVSVPGLLAPADSTHFLFSQGHHNVHSGVTGRYDLNYFIHGSSTDMYPADNYSSASMHVTSGTFCKSRYDAAGDRPIVDGHRRIGNSAVPAYTWGPLFYVAKGGYRALSAKLAINDNDTNRHDLHAVSGELVVLFKWRDIVNQNGVMEPNELSVAGVAPVHFTSTDSNDKVVTSNVFLDPVNSGPVYLEDTTYYWVAAVTPGGYSLCTDKQSGYYTRLFAGAHQATDSVKEFWSPLSELGTNDTTFVLNKTDSVMVYPFTSNARSYYPFDSLSAYARNNVPAISFHIGTVYNKVDNIAAVKADVKLWPNPAGDYLNVKISGGMPGSVGTLYIMNEAGSIVYRDSGFGLLQRTESISLKSYSPGSYYLIVTDSYTATCTKFVVVR
jgi:hypothetical protein